MDIDAIPLGVDFPDVIAKQVEACDVLIAVLGRDWLTVTDEEGHRRLDSSEDLVRLEIEAALKRNVPVIPALVRRARLPKSSDLPASLKPFVKRNGIELRDEAWHSDVERLIRGLDGMADAKMKRYAAKRPLTNAPAKRKGELKASRSEKSFATPGVEQSPSTELKEKVPAGGRRRPVKSEPREKAVVQKRPRTRAKITVISTGTESKPVDVAVGAGAIWVATIESKRAWSKRAWRIDPSTNRIEAQVSIDQGRQSAVVATDDAVWVGCWDALYRIDPTTNTAVERIAVPAPVLAVDEGAVWAANFDLSKIDARTNRVLFSVPLVDRPMAGWAGMSIAAGAGSVWIKPGVGKDRDVLFRRDPRNGRVVSEIAVQGESVAVGAGAVWLTDQVNLSGRVHKIDPQREECVKTVKLSGQLSGLTVAGDSLWVKGYARLFRIDIETLEVLGSHRRTVGFEGVAGGIAFGHGSAWVTDEYENAVVRVQM